MSPRLTLTSFKRRISSKLSRPALVCGSNPAPVTIPQRGCGRQQFGGERRRREQPGRVGGGQIVAGRRLRKGVAERVRRGDGAARGERVHGEPLGRYGRGSTLSSRRGGR